MQEVPHDLLDAGLVHWLERADHLARRIEDNERERRVRRILRVGVRGRAALRLVVRRGDPRLDLRGQVVADDRAGGWIGRLEDVALEGPAPTHRPHRRWPHGEQGRIPSQYLGGHPLEHREVVQNPDAAPVRPDDEVVLARVDL